MAGAAENLLQARRYLQSIENGTEFEELQKFLADEIKLETFPNRLLPQGNCDDLAGMRAASERGRKVMASQRVERRS